MPPGARAVAVLAPLGLLAALWGAGGRIPEAPPDAGAGARGERSGEPSPSLQGRGEPPAGPAAAVAPPAPGAPEAGSRTWEAFHCPPPALAVVDAETGLAVDLGAPWGLSVEVGQEWWRIQGVDPEGVPAGWVAPDLAFEPWETDPAPGIGPLVAVMPLRREVDVRVRLVEPPEGTRADVIVVRGEVAGRAGATERVEGRARDVSLRRVPWFRGEALRVVATVFREGVEAEGPRVAVEVPLPADPSRPVEVTMDLPAWPLEDLDDVLDVAISDHFEIDHDVPPGAGEPWTRPPPPAGFGDLVVRALRRDGGPVPEGSVVRTGPAAARTDAGGAARFEGLEAGRRSVTIDVPGMVPATVEATVVAGTETRVDLREPEGGTIEVEVVDAAERPVPFPVLRINPFGRRHLDVADGVQRLDPYGDERGRRTYRHVAPGRVHVVAAYGSRSAGSHLELAEAATRVVRLVLADAQGSSTASR